MALEIERKFLVLGDFHDEVFKSVDITQGYLRDGKGVRFRVRVADGRGILTVKGKRDASGIMREETESEIPFDRALALLVRCRGMVIEKTRHLVRNTDGRHIWEIDEFHGGNEGLVVAEIELSSPDEVFDRPSWLGKEVTADPRYHNSSLIRSPWSTWKDDD